MDEANEKVEADSAKYQTLIQDLTFIMDRDLYQAVYGKKEESDFEGEDLTNEDLDDIMSFLSGKHSLSMSDILETDDEGWG